MDFFVDFELELNLTWEVNLGPGYMRWDNPGVNAIREILQNFS